jgi:plastocyanin
MKQLLHTQAFKIFLGGFLAGVLTLAVVAFNLQRENLALREIVLVANDVEFYLEGRPQETNPTLRLKAGQPIKLVIRNEEPEKVLHCFNTGDLGVKTTGSIAGGESQALHFTPKKKGTFVYACLLHANMAGRLVVE